MNQITTCITIVAASTCSVLAQPVIDGSLDAAYGPALFVQNTNTGFGDSTDPSAMTSAGGSELDGVYGTIDNGFLYLLFTGNLENNFNKFEVFIDSEAGGVNQIDGANLPSGVDAFCCGGFGTTDGALQRMNGLTFDAGFTADHYLTFSNGTENTGDPFFPATGWVFSAHYAELGNGTSGQVSQLGGQLNPFGQEPGLGQGELVDQANNDPIGTPLHEFFEPLDPIGDPFNNRNHRDMLNDIGLLMGVDQSNVAGVGFSGGPDFTATGNPGGVTTGLEIAIPLAALGNPSGEIKVSAFISGSGHDYLSNQVTGGTLSGNLGGDGAGGFTGDLSGVDFSAINGDQFVTIIPEPASVTLMSLGLLSLQVRRRH